MPTQMEFELQLLVKEKKQKFTHPIKHVPIEYVYEYEVSYFEHLWEVVEIESSAKK